MKFANPAALLLSIFIAGLIALYLWERNRQRIDVPSLLFWESIPEATNRRNRFQPDLLFWLQLMGLSAPILGLANPFFLGSTQNQTAKHAILVLDTSASMAAIEESGPRFQTAREEARRVVQSADSSTKFALIAAARTPVLLNDFDTERSDVIELIEALETSDVAADLEPALILAQKLVQQHDGSTEIHVFSDTPLESTHERWRNNVNWWPVGSTDDNLAIVGVESERPFLSRERTDAVYVRIQNFGHNEKHGAVALHIGGRAIGTELFTAPPHSEHGFLFSDVSSSGLVEASLLNSDALDVDNRFFAWRSPARQIHIAVVSPNPELHAALQHIARASAGLKVAAIDDIDVDGLRPGDTDLIILHRAPLTGQLNFPAIPMLLIAPSTELNSQAPSTTLGPAEIVDWNDAHPILRGIDPQLLSPFQSTVAIVPPTSGQTVLVGLINGREEPLVVTTGEADDRVAIVGPDLADMGLLSTDGETALLLFLNLVDWLTAQPAPVSIVRTGQSRAVSMAEGPPTEVIDPAGRQANLQNGAAPFLTFDHAGRYEIRHPNQPAELVFANFLDVAESNIGRAPSPAHRVPVEDSHRRVESVINGPLKSWLYVIAAMFLLSEWFVAGRIQDDA